MSLISIAKLFGWIVVIGYAVALMNYFVKQINKKYVSKLPKEQKKFKDFYMKIMKFVIKNHKTIGILTSLIIICHFIIIFIKEGISITGLIAVVIMLLVFLLGIFGAYFNKSKERNWVKIHRALAFALVLAIPAHLMFK